MAGNARCRQGEGHRPTAYLACANVHTRSTRDHRPMLGDYAWSCGSWSLYSATGNIPMALSEAIIATYMTIHMARSPGSHSGRIASPCQEFREGAEILRVWLSGNESNAFVLSEEPILLAKISAFAAHSWASGTRDWN